MNKVFAMWQTLIGIGVCALLMGMAAAFFSCLLRRKLSFKMIIRGFSESFGASASINVNGAADSRLMFK